MKIWTAIDEQIMQPFFAPNAHDSMNHSDTGDFMQGYAFSTCAVSILVKSFGLVMMPCAWYARAAG